MLSATKKVVPWLGAVASALTVLRQVKDFVDLSKFAKWLVESWRAISHGFWGYLQGFVDLELWVHTRDFMTLTVIAVGLYIRYLLSDERTEEADYGRSSTWLGLL